MATVRELLVDSTARLVVAGSETPRLDAEVMLAHVLRVDRTTVLAHPEAPVGEAAAEAFRAALERRERGEPVAYIRGFKEFHGLAFATDERALIPRPETERLVDLAEVEITRRLIAQPRPAGTPRLRVVDVGVGTGAVIVTLAVILRRRHMLDEVELAATDLSADALHLARENAVAHAVGDRIEFEEADLLPGWQARRWEVVLANLPYVRSEVVPALPRAAAFEPAIALDGGVDGLAVIGRLLDLLAAGLDRDGVAMLEIGADQEAGMRALVGERLPGWSVEIELDLGRLPRVAVVRPPKT
jgi:release factor glutamine methyltransferase